MVLEKSLNLILTNGQEPCCILFSIGTEMYHCFGFYRKRSTTILLWGVYVRLSDCLSSWHYIAEWHIRQPEPGDKWCHDELLLLSYRWPPTQSRHSAGTSHLVVLLPVASLAFPVVGPRIWNNLPANVTSAESLCTFHERLKTHLFSEPFPRYFLDIY